MKTITKKIVRESLRMLILSSIISSIGGIGIEIVQEKVIQIIPLIIIIPALNHMMGNLSTVLASKYSTLLYLGRINESNWQKSKDISDLKSTLYTIAIILAFYLSVIGYIIALLKGYPLNIGIFLKIIIMSLAISLILLKLVFMISVSLGFYLFKRGKDPSTYLIPILTSIGDMGAMLFLALFVIIFF
ncbi:MAG: magnesium transporter [Candidatus Woesearchaeota archaeon]